MSSKLANQLLNEFSTVLDDVSVKAFFSGFSIHCQDTIFGWIGTKGFYLRGHASYRDLFIEQKMERLRLPAGVTMKLLDYYRVNDDLLNDRQRLHTIVKMVIESARQEKKHKIKCKELRIKTLPNMTLSLERLLLQVGINNVATLREIGYLEAFVRVKQYKKDVSTNLLFVLYGALNKYHVAALSPAIKQEIKSSYQRLLN
ncbi:TfoX/Sxy family DNA transformation protein [Orbaceae bacterium ESL0727]|nr:TfoX/Sxy family DNA transformation protein [Orbaceae bacterium ESL0727]